MGVVETKCDFFGSCEVETFHQDTVLRIINIGILVESQAFWMSGTSQSPISLVCVVPGLSEIGKKINLTGNKVRELELLFSASVTHAVIK